MSDAVASSPPTPSLTAPPPDEDVLVRMAGGRTEAFAEIYERFAHRVYGLAKRVVRDAAMAEEVAHDALLDVWARSRSLNRSRETARARILTIAHRRAVDAVRSEQPSRDRLVDRAARAWHADYDEVSESAISNLTSVRDAVALLTPLQRQSVQLAYFGGFSHREVAEILEVPVGTAKSRINSGLRRLPTELINYG